MTVHGPLSIRTGSSKNKAGRETVVFTAFGFILTSWGNLKKKKQKNPKKNERTFYFKNLMVFKLNSLQETWTDPIHSCGQL